MAEYDYPEMEFKGMSRMSASRKKMQSVKNLSTLSMGSAPDFVRSSSLTSRVSQRFGFDEESSDTIRPARLVFKQYLAGEIPKDEVALAEVLPVRVLKTSPTAAVARWTRFRGLVSLGAGRIMVNMKRKQSAEPVRWTFDLGMIKNIGYKHEGAKDFSLSFHHNAALLNIVCKDSMSAQNWLVSLFAEIRLQASIFWMILKDNINPLWADLLNIQSLKAHASSVDDRPLTEDEQRELVMDDQKMTVAERCLREEIDLYTLCRGADHPDVCEAYERLAIWLRRIYRMQEGKYWEKAAEAGRANYAQRMKYDMNPADATMVFEDQTALEELRNPSGMKPWDNLSKQKAQNGGVDMAKRKAEVYKKLLESLNFGKKKSGDSGSELIDRAGVAPATFIVDAESDPFEDLL